MNPRSLSQLIVTLAACGTVLSIAVLKPRAEEGVSAPIQPSIQSLAKLPMRFEALPSKEGQRPSFVTRGRGYSMAFSGGEATIALSTSAPSMPRELSQPSTLEPTSAPISSTAVVRMTLVGARENTQAVLADELPGTANYFLGSDSTQWRTGVKGYSCVRYDGVYDGIDVVYYGNQDRLEYDFVVAPHANPELIKLAFAGTDQVSIDANGDLLLDVAGEELRQLRPIIYQEITGVPLSDFPIPLTP